MMKLFILLFLSCVCGNNIKSGLVNRLFEDYWKWRLFISPSVATSIGYTEYKYASRLAIFTEQDFNTTRAVAEMFLRKAKKITSIEEELDEQTELSLKLFMTEIQGFLDGFPYKGYLLGQTTFLQGPHKGLDVVFRLQRKKTKKDFMNLLCRMLRVPGVVMSSIDMMKEGIRVGRTEHFYSMDGVPKQIRKAISDDKIYKENFENITESIPEKTRVALQKKGRDYLDRYVYFAYNKLAEFVETEYMNHVRAEIAISSVPDGPALYQQLLKFYTTTTMTPQQIHQLGIAQVTKTEKKMKEVISQLGHSGMSIQKFSELIKSDPSSFYSSKEELMSSYRDAVYNKINPTLNQVFWHLPKQNVTIVAEEDPLATGAYYRRGSSISGRPGEFYIATSRYKTQPKHELITLSMHEANPGHHFHFAMMQENDKLPLFRKFSHRTSNAPSDFNDYTAFIEGWALYSETLGNDLGLYDEDLMQKFGHLGYSMLRAVRLVVDTGMHALGWSRDKAINYMLKYTPMTKDNIEIEINRYITWPGQACSYKIGELKIQELRERAEQQLGNQYDIRDFHQTVLECYGPMHILEECVDSYINKYLA